MAKIPVVVVDDEKFDRLVVRRRLAEAADFGEVIEATSGDDFLDMFFSERSQSRVGDARLLVLMDINLPGKSGFETVAEMEQRAEEGRGPQSVVVMMFTSSDNPANRERASALKSIRGYIIKPMDSDNVATILQMYRS